MAKKIVIADTYIHALNTARVHGIPPVNAILVSPKNWRQQIRGRNFTEKDIVWGPMPEGQVFGVQFWEELDAILASPRRSN